MSKPDLLNLCLVKPIYRLATTVLYGNLTVVIGDKMDRRVQRLWSRHNRGLDHVRRLRVELDVGHWDRAEHAFDHLTCLINALPTNKLTHFR